MRQPQAVGTPIDAERLAEWIDRFGGYRRNVTRGRINAWLEQFDSEHRDLAARLLDAVEFINNQEIESGLSAALDGLPGWDKAKKRRNGVWRFVAFSRTAGESGDTMLHKLRSSAGLSSARYDELFVNKRDLLSENLGPEDSVVFVDDFAGTGQQVCTGWTEVMEELLPGAPRVYLLLVAASRAALTRITRETPIEVRNSLSLGPEDNIFSNTCNRFSRRDKNSLRAYCRRANQRIPYGYGGCGFVVVLAHKTPNNSIPVLYATQGNWQGLFPR